MNLNCRILFASVLIFLAGVANAEGAVEACYETVESTSSNVPSYFCLTSAQVEPEGAYLKIKGTFPTYMKITKKTQKQITAEATVLDNWDNTECGTEGEVAILELAVPNTTSAIDIKNLNLSLHFTYWADTCRAFTSQHTFELVRVK